MKFAKMIGDWTSNLMLVGAVLHSPASLAQAMLGSEEVKTLIVGNTVETQRPNGSRFLAYFEPSGIWLRQEGGKVTEGKWRILDNGDQCVTVGREDSCAQMQKNTDGTYTRMQNGKAQFSWLKVMPGKGF